MRWRFTVVLFLGGHTGHCSCYSYLWCSGDHMESDMGLLHPKVGLRDPRNCTKVGCEQGKRPACCTNALASVFRSHSQYSQGSNPGLLEKDIFHPKQTLSKGASEALLGNAVVTSHVTLKHLKRA